MWHTFFLHWFSLCAQLSFLTIASSWWLSLSGPLVLGTGNTYVAKYFQQIRSTTSPPPSSWTKWVTTGTYRAALFLLWGTWEVWTYVTCAIKWKPNRSFYSSATCLCAQTHLGQAIIILICCTYQLWVCISWSVLDDTRPCPWIPRDWLTWLYQTLWPLEIYDTNTIQIMDNSSHLPAQCTPHGNLFGLQFHCSSTPTAECMLHASTSYHFSRNHWPHWCTATTTSSEPKHETTFKGAQQTEQLTCRLA